MLLPFLLKEISTTPLLSQLCIIFHRLMCWEGNAGFYLLLIFIELGNTKDKSVANDTTTEPTKTEESGLVSSGTRAPKPPTPPTSIGSLHLSQDTTTTTPMLSNSDKRKSKSHSGSRENESAEAGQGPAPTANTEASINPSTSRPFESGDHSGGVEEEMALHEKLKTSAVHLFYHLYGIFPCNFLHFVKTCCEKDLAFSHKIKASR